MLRLYGRGDNTTCTPVRRAVDVDRWNRFGVCCKLDDLLKKASQNTFPKTISLETNWKRLLFFYSKFSVNYTCSTYENRNDEIINFPKNILSVTWIGRYDGNSYGKLTRVNDSCDTIERTLRNVKRKLTINDHCRVAQMERGRWKKTDRRETVNYKIFAVEELRHVSWYINETESFPKVHY